MTTKQFVALGRQLLPIFPSAVVHGPLIAIVPVGQILRAVCFDRTSDKTEFCVWAFWFPLYVPTEHIYFNFGKSIRNKGSEYWRSESPHLVDELASAIRSEAFPFLEKASTPQGVIDELRYKVVDGQNPHSYNALVHALAKEGDISGALQTIDELMERLDLSRRNRPGLTEWQVELEAKAKSLKEKLLVGKQSEIDALLESQRLGTIRALGLEPICDIP